MRDDREHELANCRTVLSMLWEPLAEPDTPEELRAVLKAAKRETEEKIRQLERSSEQPA